MKTWKKLPADRAMHSSALYMGGRMLETGNSEATHSYSYPIYLGLENGTAKRMAIIYKIMQQA